MRRNIIRPPKPVDIEAEVDCRMEALVKQLEAGIMGELMAEQQRDLSWWRIIHTSPAAPVIIDPRFFITTTS